MKALLGVVMVAVGLYGGDERRPLFRIVGRSIVVAEPRGIRPATPFTRQARVVLSERFIWKRVQYEAATDKSRVRVPSSRNTVLGKH